MPANRNSRRKIAFIGASHLFVHQSVRDFVLNGKMENTDLYLYDIAAGPLEVEYDLIRRMIKQGHSKITVQKSPTRRAAIEGADYVVMSVLVGGLDAAEKDDKICQKYNIRHTVGDTIGPMCTARCLRQIPLILDVAKDMRKYCPKAPLLSPTNPMAAMTDAAIRYGGVDCIGICHGSHFIMDVIARAYGVKIEDVAINLVGVNHFAFVDEVRIKGVKKPLDKAIKQVTAEALKGYADPAGHIDKAEYAIQYASRIGFLPNNGDHHFIEFFPWFLAPHSFKNGKSRYGLEKILLSVPDRRKRKVDLKKLLLDWTNRPQPIPDMDKYSSEHIHDIIFGLEGRNRDQVISNLHLNVLNGNSVPNLPKDALLELTVDISPKGVKPVKNPPLDTYRWATLAPLIGVNTLAVEAAVHQDKKAFIQALHLDPLTRDFDTIPAMAEELWNASKPYFKPKK
ncbi:MAG: hypothetical protein ABIF71_01065 [Planctomycetota bacterium]